MKETYDLSSLSLDFRCLSKQLTGVEAGAASRSCARAGSLLGVPGWAGGRCLASLPPCRAASCCEDVRVPDRPVPGGQFHHAVEEHAAAARVAAVNRKTNSLR